MLKMPGELRLEVSDLASYVTSSVEVTHSRVLRLSYRSESSINNLSEVQNLMLI